MIKFRAKTLNGWTVDSPLQSVTFPDGAVHISGADNPTSFDFQIAWVTGLDHSDLFTLAMWADVCSSRGERSVLVLPYLPGARMDRGVPFGSAIYGDFIRTMVRPDKLVTLDPHSDSALVSFKGSLFETIVFPVERIIRQEIQDPSIDLQVPRYVGVIAPDAGAVGRASRAAKVMGVPLFRAEKVRDFSTGKLSGFGMKDHLPSEGKLLIVDDICDGGGTFLGLAEATGLTKDRLDLFVTHGVFSKGFDSLSDHFGRIYTTNSFFTGECPENVEVFDLVKYLSADAVI